MNLVIVKYNAGNIQSVLYALERIGQTAIVTDDHDAIRNADKVIFPGVGEASSAMRYLQERGLDNVLKNLQQPVLGICLGMQLMCAYSEENNTNCLGIFDEQVRKFQVPQQSKTVFKIPQMGWNQIYNLKSKLFDQVAEQSFCYFVHGYYAAIGVHTIATTDYIHPYSAALQKDNFYGVQFHPEKSATIGEQILRNFLNESLIPSLKNKSMFIIPAIDIIEGKCVRLTEGDYAQKKIYNENPLEVAKAFEDMGLNRLHLVDLDGAKAGAVKNWKVLEQIAGHTSLVIDFGGGIKKEGDLQIVFNSGAALATIGSLAVKDANTFEQWLNQYGAEKFLLGADVKQEKIAVGGWLETTNIDIYDFIQQYINKGVKQLFCTDVSKDGKLEGPSLALYENILKQFTDLYFIASGGVSCLKDLEDLRTIGCSAAIVGKAIYEQRISLAELKKFIQSSL